ncbi:MAG: response regulator, partial [Planctomycetota bacterium]
MAGEAAARRVLVIDDEETILRTFARYLRSESYEVTTATGGEEALAEMQREPYPVVLLDLKMPGMGGLDVLTRIREAYARCEVIIVSGHGQMEDSIEALRRGANNYLQKPVDLEELSICVERAFDKRERAERLRAVQDQLYHVQKMEALGTLGGGVAHEFNNLMGGIIGYCDMALTQDDP